MPMTSLNDEIEDCSASCSETDSNILTNVLRINKEYDGFIKFIKESAEPVKCDLVQFLYPLYVYIYLILLKGKRVLAARKFISTYSNLFLNAEGYKEVIEDLFKFKNYQEPKKHTYFKNFYVNKYVVKASKDNLKLLEAYLQEAECAVLLTILHSQFQVQVAEKKRDRKEDSVNFHKKKDSIHKSSETLEHGKIHSSRNDDARKMHNESQRKLCNHLYTISCSKINLCSVDIDKDNKFLACGFENSKIYVWDMESSSTDLLKQAKKKVGKKVKKSKLDDRITTQDCSAKLQVILKGHQGSVYGLAYSSMHNLLLSCSGDTTVRAWSTKNSETVNVYRDHEYPIWDVTVSPDCTYFVTASMDFTARLWSFEQSHSLRIFAGHSSDVDCVRFHPHSKYLATASADKTIQLWTFEDAKSVRHFVGHNSYINSIAFAPNGQQMASADDAGNIIIWDLGSGKILKSIFAHSGRILNISYNKNGSFIASGGFDHFLRVWDVNLSPIETELKGVQLEGQVDSYALNSVLHHVSFHENNTLTSVGTFTK